MASASEVSFFSLSPAEFSEIEKMENKPSRFARILLEKPKDLLAAILIANNFFNVSIVILGAYLSAIIFPAENTEPLLKFLIDVVIITFVILLFGEVIPKYYATRYGTRVLLFMAAPIYYFSNTPPFSWLIQGLVRGTAVINKRGKSGKVDVSSTELSHALELTMEEETDTQDQQILHGIVRFGKKDVKQIMKSRTEVSAAPVSLSFDQLYQLIVQCGFSRIPVYRDSFDTIEGILFVKDLLPHLDQQNGFQWQKLIREPYFVPENKKIDDLLKSFQERKVHMAVVVDEYGGTSGIVTLEDVLEEIVGDISDEFDDEDLTYSKLDNSNYVFEGKTLLVDIYKVLDIDGKEFESEKAESDSLGGFITEQAGRLLKKDEKLRFGRYEFTVESADNRRVKRIKLTILDEKKNDE
ncbi:MAG: gliding motility-associated protein GldE [Bacteroidetes bacterium]|nr:gliding motility-associated protein GldE [Bacteroidota bacterium]